MMNFAFIDTALSLPLWGWALLIVCLGLFGYGLSRALRWLCGPVLFYEMVRSSRKRSGLYLRCAYAFLMLVVLFILYITWFRPDLSEGPAVLFAPAELPPSQGAAFAGSFFGWFLFVQFLVVAIVTPAVTGGAISEEKQSRMIELMLTSHLRDHEIVLGKMAARVGGLILLLLTALPLLGFLQFLGGVDPNLVLVSFGVMLLNLLSIASLSIYNSVLFRNPRRAVVVTYGEIAGFLCISVALLFPMRIFVPDETYWINASNIFLLWFDVQDIGKAGMLAEELPKVLAATAIWHVSAATLFAIFSTSALRTKAIAHSGAREESKHKLPPGFVKPPPPPPPFDPQAPLLWREKYFEYRGTTKWMNPELPFFMAFWLTAGSFYLIALLNIGSGYGSDYREGGLYLLRVANAIFTLVLWLKIAIRASTTLSAEREQQTLDSLLTTDLSDRELLSAKWKACLWSTRKDLWSLLILYTLAALTLSINPLSAIVLSLAAVVHLCFILTAAMYCSLVSESNLRANSLTLLILGIALMGHWIIAFLSVALFWAFGMPDAIRWVSDFHWYGLTPPVTQWTVAFSAEKTPRMGPLGIAMMGVIFYTVLTWYLWYSLLTRFGKVTGRVGGN